MRNFTNKILNSNIGLVCIILLLGLVAHSFMLPATFKTLDDSISIINNSDIKSFSNIGKIFKSSYFGSKHYYRPMASLSYMIEYHFAGLRSFYYNLTNLTLHLAIAVSVFFLILLILKDRTMAFFTSLLFAVHPVQWEAVSNISGRAILLSTFFTINAFFFYCLIQKKWQSYLYYGLSLLFFTCGLFAKESAAMFPVLLLSYILLMEKDRKRCALVVPYLLGIGIYFLLRRSLGIIETYPWRSGQEHVLGFLTFLRACLTYVRLFIWPVDLHFDRAQKMFVTFLNPELWVTVMAYVTSGIILLKAKRRFTKPVLFFMAWVCIELFPVSQIVTTIGVRSGYISAAEHFLYMPAVGIFVLLVTGGRRLYYFILKRKFCSSQVLQFTLSGIFLFFIGITAGQGLNARTSLTMFRRTLAYNPNNTRILYSMGIELANRQRYAEAEHYFRQALAGEPVHYISAIALGRALHDQGKYLEAITVYEALNNTGHGNKLIDDNLEESYQKAVEQYREWIVQDPRNAQLYYSLGTVYSRSNRIREGIQQYKAAIALNPAHKNALFNLASSYDVSGDKGWAVAYYERVAALNAPKDELDQYAYKRLGEIYRDQGDEAKAREYFEKMDLAENETPE